MGSLATVIVRKSLLAGGRSDEGSEDSECDLVQAAGGGSKSAASATSAPPSLFLNIAMALGFGASNTGSSSSSSSSGGFDWRTLLGVRAPLEEEKQPLMSEEGSAATYSSEAVAAPSAQAPCYHAASAPVLVPAPTRAKTTSQGTAAPNSAPVAGGAVVASGATPESEPSAPAGTTAAADDHEDTINALNTFKSMTGLWDIDPPDSR